MAGFCRFSLYLVFSIACILLIPAVFANADVSNKNAEFLKAAENGNFAAIQTLLAEVANPNTKSDNDETALMFASSKGHTEIVQLLEKAGAKE